MRAAKITWSARIGLGLLALFAALPLLSAERGEPRGGGGAPGRAPVMVDRANHGSIRHVDTHVVSRPVAVAPRSPSV